jgi:5-formyltetrahydrofolate cyclo-ligase
MLLSKADLRKTLLKTRQAMAVEEWQHKSQRVEMQVRSLPLFWQAHTVLAYFSTRQELDLSCLWGWDNSPDEKLDVALNTALNLELNIAQSNNSMAKIWGFPRCVGDDLVWHDCTALPRSRLQTGKFGILEPPLDAPLIAVTAVDLILVPCVACDRQGYRLGYGGGFYDRLLSQPEWRSKPTVGIVFQSAWFDALPHDPWDRPLTAVCSEVGWSLI